MPAPGREELFDLCARLRGEKLLVSSEIDQLQQLNQDVDQKLTELLQYSWISRQQQFTLSKLLNSHPDATAQNCCRQTRTLAERTEFTEAYRKLGGGINEIAAGDFARLLYENARLTAELLHRCDQGVGGANDSIYDLSHVVFSAVYGCAVFPSDERRVLETLYYLMRLQLLPNAQQARRMLRRGTCAFSRLYKWLITDGGGLYSTKLFLLSALHQPIVDLISSEELFLDIDPGKAVVRFPPSERLRRFGEEGTPAYKENLSKYRREIVTRLVSMAQRFIQSLKTSFYACFPPPLAWLLRQLYESLLMSGKTTSSEASLIVTDLVFTCFICPAIANPEPLGIVVETPITHIARFNLMQIGQILQTLAVSPWEKLDPKLMDLYGQLDAEAVSSLVTALLIGTPTNQQQQQNRGTSPGEVDLATSVAVAISSLEEVYDKNDNVNRPGYDGGVQPSTRVALMTVGELNRMMQAFRRVSQEAGGGDDQMTEMWRELKTVLSRLPESFADDQQAQLQAVAAAQSNGGNSPNAAGAPPRKRTPLKLPKPRIPSVMSNSPSVERLQNLLSGGDRGNSSTSGEATTPDGSRGDAPPDSLGSSSSSSSTTPMQQVLMIPLGGQRDPIGLTSEEAFLTSSSSSSASAAAAANKQAANIKDGGATEASGGGGGDGTSGSGGHHGGAPANEKRTRFSLQNQPDLESVGTSDQMDDDDRESVSSSVEGNTNPDMMQGLMMNDNFSEVDADQLSPNVSGRGSPNVSGRDTPLSSHTEQQVFPGEPELDAPLSPSAAHDGEMETNRAEDQDQDASAAAGDRQGQLQQRHHHHHHHHHGFQKRGLLMPDLPVTAQKENGADIEDRFGKFEIPSGPHNQRERHRDETHSLVSDSWSTDVLASDSEFGGEYSAAMPPGGMVPAGALPDIVPGQIPEFPRLDLIAEEEAAAAAAAAGGREPSASRGGPQGQGGGTRFVDPEAVMMAACDRSDTWSVDAMASDSEADTTSVTQRNDDLRDLEMDEARQAEGAPANRGTRGGGAGASAASTAGPSNRGASIPPEITFSMERDFHQMERGVVRRQSSGSSFVSRQSDFDDQQQATAAGQPSKLTDPKPPNQRQQDEGESSSKKPDVEPKNQPPSDQQQQQQRGHLSSASSDASSVDTASARAVSGSPTSEERQLAAMRATGAIPKKFRQISAQLAGSLERNNPFHQQQQPPPLPPPGFAGAGDMMDARRGFFKGFNKGLNNLKSKVKRSQTTGGEGGGFAGGFGSPGGGGGAGIGRSESPDSRGRSGNTLDPGSLNMSHSTSIDSFNNSMDSNSGAGVTGGAGETSDEILAKYRRQKPTDQQPLDVIAPSDIPITVGESLDTGGAGGGGGIAASGSSTIDGAFPSMSDFNDSSSMIVHAPSSTKLDTSNNINNDGESSSSMAAMSRANQNGSAASFSSDSNRPPYLDPQNVAQCQAFLDAKRKLRQVLSSVDVAALPGGFDSTAAIPKSPKEASSAGVATTNQQQIAGGDLIQFLRLLLADALTDNRSTQQKHLTAQLRETIRCLQFFDQKTIRKLLRALHDEHRRRTAYLAYLQQSRLSLLQMRAYLEKLTGRIMREQMLSCECLLELCSRIFLEQRMEQQLRRFVVEFHKLEAHDEKTDLVERFLTQLYSAMQRDPIWQWASDEQVQFARLSIERSVMAQIYLAAMHPNGEGDTMRDHVFFETIKRLAAIVTPNHRDLKIPPEYHAECPWPSAQAEIAVINAYKTPRDKIACVVRCCQTIVSLLRLARPDGQPAADDLIPVLVFVIIKSNPPSLLSNVQYVTNFYGTRVEGEEAYWWTQFCSAVEFIKMMADYHQAN